MEFESITNGSRQPKRLACRYCQRRKIKCSRDYPCIQCKQNGIVCEQSSRKKRAKPKIRPDREADLRVRVESLERLVQQINGDQSSSQASVDVLPSTNKYLASPFWNSITDEVQALRETLEGSEGGSDGEATDSASSPTSPVTTGTTTSTNDSFDFILCGPSSILVLPDALSEPEPGISSSLCQVFVERVDRTWKIFHAPTLQRFVEADHTYLGRAPETPSNQALKAAVQFAAISQLSDAEFEQLCGLPRARLSDLYRRRVEMKLIQADPMNSSALATLQALVLYVAALRRNDTSRRGWAIFALVVRLARAFNLHRESADESFFLREIRRRLWHNIIVMDAFFALDRGSEPLITDEPSYRPLPGNINDDDFNESSMQAVPRQMEVTDMTFALVVEEFSACIHRINFLANRPVGETWQHRLSIARELEKDINAKYLGSCDPSNDFHRLILKIAKAVSLSMSLRTVRPLQRDPSYLLPPINSLWVFDLAIETLRQSCDMRDDLPLMKFKQLAWVQWHPIAVALAGLCSNIHEELTTEREAEAWHLIDRMMAQASISVADSRRGTLWMPIEKMYKRAQAMKCARARSEGSTLRHGLKEASNAEEMSAAAVNRLIQQPHNGIPANNPIQMSFDSELDAIGTLEIDGWLDWDAVLMNAQNAENEPLWL